MKARYRKPKNNTVSDMMTVAGTIRQRLFGPLNATGRPSYHINTATYAYPDGHPMRSYRDMKKAARRARK